MSNFVKGVIYPQKVYSYWQKEQNLEHILELQYANKWLLDSTLICIDKKKKSKSLSLYIQLCSKHKVLRKEEESPLYCLIRG